MTTVNFSTDYSSLSGSTSYAPTTTIIPAPDDRYIDGYTVVSQKESFQNIVLVTTFGPRMVSLDVGWQTYGKTIPMSYGTRRLSGDIIWALPFEEFSVFTKDTDGGWTNPGHPGGVEFDLGDPSLGWETQVFKTTEYFYTSSFAVSFGQPLGNATNRQILRIWANDVLMVDNRTGKTVNGDWNYRFYPGTDDQLPDPMIADHAEAEGSAASAYRGLMYLVFEKMPIESFGNTIPHITIEVADGASDDYFEEVVNPQLGSYFTNTHAVDWDYNRMWRFSATTNLINEFNIASYTPVRNIVCSQALKHEYFCYIPWMFKAVLSNTVVVSDADTLVLVDLMSGGVLAELSTVPLFGGIRRSVPIQVTGDGLTMETYVAVITQFAHVGIYRILSPNELDNGEDWEIREVYEADFSGARIQFAPGNIYDGESDIYFLIGDVVRRFTITSGGNVTVETFLDLSAGDECDMIYFYHPEDALLVARETGATSFPDYWEKYDAATGTLQGSSVSTLNGMFWNPGNNYWMSNPQNGVLAAPGSGAASNVVLLDIEKMTTSKITLSGLQSGNNDITDNQSMSYVTTSGYRVFWRGMADSRTTLAGFLEALAEDAAGYSLVTEFEVDGNVDDLIDGAVLLTRTSFRAVLDNLALPYRYDIVESEGMIKIVRKSQQFVSYQFDVPQIELAVISEGDPENISLQSRREDEVSLPKRAEIIYASRELDYHPSIQFAQRSSFPANITESDEVMRVTVPVIIRHTEAKKLVYQMLYAKAWTSRASYSFRLSQKYQYLEPSDVGKITSGAFTYTVALKEVHYNADFSLSCAATAYLSEEPIVNLDADGGTINDQELVGKALPLMLPLDCKLIRPGQDRAYPNGVKTTMYYLLSPFGDVTVWVGVSGEVSADGGLTWTLIGQNKSIPTLGIVNTAPAVPSSSYLIQEEEELVIRVVTSSVTSLSTVTYAELMEGKNLALVGSPALGWELIQYKDATNNGNGEWALSYLIRGRRGTDVHMEADSPPLAAGSWFIPVTIMSKLEVVRHTLDLEDTILTYRVTNLGSNPLLSTSQRFTFQAESAKPLRPEHIEMEWAGSDIDLSFIRQTRGAAPWIDGEEDVALAESVENFRVTIYTDLTFATASDTIDLDGTDETSGRYHALITAAMLNTAYGTSTPDTIHVGVKQHSTYIADYGDERFVSLTTGV